MNKKQKDILMRFLEEACAETRERRRLQHQIKRKVVRDLLSDGSNYDSIIKYTGIEKSELIEIETYLENDLKD